MGKRIEYVRGQRFIGTRFVFLEDRPPLIGKKERRALFQCDCGVQKELPIFWVRHLNSTSCGCYQTEYMIQVNTTHSNAPRDNPSGAYRSWQALQQRVKVDPNYSHVSICPSWLGEEGFITFLKDMGDRPANHTIERVNNLGNYEASNCIWATQLTQAQNSRNTKHITINNQTHSISEWCRIMGIGYYLVKQRRKRGMSIEDAITTPVDKTKQRGKK